MRALLDTNMIIHRESLQATNYSIGRLYYWLDKLHYEKLIHPYSLSELRKTNNAAQQLIRISAGNAFPVSYTARHTSRLTTRWHSII